MKIRAVGPMCLNDEDDAALLPSFPLEPSAAGAEPAGLQPGEFVAAADVAPRNRELVAHQFAATTGKDRGTAGETCALLLAIAGGRTSDAAVRGDAGRIALLPIPLDRSAGPAQAAESVYKRLGKEEKCCKSGGISGNFGGAGTDLRSLGTLRMKICFTMPRASEMRVTIIAVFVVRKEIPANTCPLSGDGNHGRTSCSGLCCRRSRSPMMGPSVVEGLRSLAPQQLRAALADFLPKEATAAEQTSAIEAALSSPMGGALREAMARWIVDEIVPVERLVPQAYVKWRPPVRDAMMFVVTRLSPARLAPKLLEQLELPLKTPAEVRLLRLIAKVPGLQKLGQVIARNRNLRPALRNALSRLENGIRDVRPEDVVAIIRQELGPRIEKYAVEIAPTILSEASVSAVVRFTWWDPESGKRERGVFKVLKPHIPEYFAEDMDYLQGLAQYFGDSAAQLRICRARDPRYFQESPAPAATRGELCSRAEDASRSLESVQVDARGSRAAADSAPVYIQNYRAHRGAWDQGNKRSRPPACCAAQESR